MRARLLSCSDLDGVYELDRACFSEETAFSRDYFVNLLSDPLSTGFGIEDEQGRLVAFAVVSALSPRLMSLVTIDVHPRFQGRGLGHKLMEIALRFAREQSASLLLLQVAVDNAPAIALYRKHGFQVKGLLQDYYGPGKDAFLMVRQVKEDGLRGKEPRTPRARAHGRR